MISIFLGANQAVKTQQIPSQLITIQGCLCFSPKHSTVPECLTYTKKSLVYSL